MRNLIKMIPYVMLSAVLMTTLCVSQVFADNTSASLSLRPSKIIVPLIDIDSGATLVAVNVDLNNVTNLKDFEFIIMYDGQRLEFFDYISGTTWNLSGSGGRSGSGGYAFTIYRTLRDLASGSGSLYTLWFKPLKIGTASVSIVAGAFKDDKGTFIPITVNGSPVTIEIVSLGSEFKVLSDKHTQLEADYTTLKTDFSLLDEEFKKLESDNNELVTKLDTLVGKYSQLNTDNIQLNADFSALDEKYSTLASDNKELMINLESLLMKYEAKLKESNELKVIIYTVLSVLLVLVVVVAVMAVKLFKKAKP